MEHDVLRSVLREYGDKLSNMKLEEKLRSEARRLQLGGFSISGFDFQPLLTSDGLPGRGRAAGSSYELPLSFVDLERVEFSDCRLPRSLHRSRMKQVRFDRCVGNKASFDDSNLQDVEIVDCDLVRTSFFEASLVGVVFRSCNLARGRFDHADLKDVVFDHCHIDGVSLDLAAPVGLQVAGMESGGRVLTHTRTSAELLAVLLPSHEITVLT